jgi:4'-phosphopantetheinyl transferase EntD
MALKVYKDINKDLKLGIWRIDETLSSLEQSVLLSSKETAVYSNFKTERRKKEWLATRELLLHMNVDSSVCYFKNGKPYLADCNISISHTKNWVALILNSSFHCGLDIERVSEKAIRVKSKFVNSEEVHGAFGKMGLSEKDYYTLLWSIKEAVYKRFSQEESLEFKHGICLGETPNTNMGNVTCFCKGKNLERTVTLEYQITSDYALAYTLD